MDSPSILDSPAAGIFGFYFVVFVTAECCRNAIDIISPPFLKVYFYELIGTITMCLCVFENGYVLMNYGYVAFFVVVTIVLYTGAYMNRGAQVSPLGSFENVYYGTCNVGHFVGIFFSQLVAAISAFLLVGHVWIYTGRVFSFHQNKVEDLARCKVNYKTSFTFMVVFEFLACAAIRLLMPLINSKSPDSIRSYAIPAFVSFMITLSIYTLGAAGLNPVVASCRMFFCKGLDKQWFIFLYWAVSAAGYIFGASLSRVFFPAFYKPKKDQFKSRPVPDSVKEKISKKQNAKNKKKKAIKAE